MRISRRKGLLRRQAIGRWVTACRCFDRAPWILLAGLGALTLAGPSYSAASPGEVVHTTDFTGQPAGPAIQWLRNEGYELRLDATALDPQFTDQGLTLSTKQQRAGLFGRKLTVPDARWIRIEWGVERYPDGADWENGIYRVPIAVMVSFGEKEISSGSFFLPNMPYFISVFLSRNAEAGKGYTANYYHKGGRYYCGPCAPRPGETVTTTFDLQGAFREAFAKDTVPPIKGISFQMNTKDTTGGARAYLRRIEFLKR